MPDTRLIKNQQATAVVGVVHTLNSAVIFSMLLKEATREMLQHTAGMVVFPIAAGSALLEMLLAWRERHLRIGEKGLLVNALVQTVFALGMTSVVTVSAVFTSMSLFISPLIMFSVTAAKALYHWSSALYYQVQMYQADNPQDKLKYKNARDMNLVKGVAATFAGIAIGVGILLGKPLFAVFGIVGGVVGGFFAVYKLIKIARASQAAATAETGNVDVTLKNTDAPSPTNSARLHNQFKPQSTSTLDDVRQPLLADVAAIESPSVAPVATVINEDERLRMVMA